MVRKQVVAQIPDWLRNAWDAPLNNLDLSAYIDPLIIQNKKQKLVQFRPNNSQLKVLDQVHEDLRAGRPSRIIVLKARQLGISTVTQAIMFSLLLRVPNTSAVVIAHESPAGQGLFAKTRLFYETLDEEMKSYFPHRYATRKQLVLDSNRSSLEVLTAENSESARSRTINALHCSEVAFWKEPEEAMLALKDCVPDLPGTLILIESTANGQGNYFHQEWLQAMNGESDYTPIFLPWWDHHEYQRAVPKNGLGELDEEELALKEGFDVSDERLSWRRRQIRNNYSGDVERFHQEHPSTWEEAFISSGRNVFEEAALDTCYTQLPVSRGSLHQDARKLGRISFATSSSERPFRAWFAPRRQATYFIGASPQHPAFTELPSVAQVINRDTTEQVAVWEAITDPITFAEELAKLGTYYNNALVAPDVEDMGYPLIEHLARIYPHIWRHQLADRRPGKGQSKMALGYSNSWKRQQWGLGWVIRHINTGKLQLHDEATYNDLLTLQVQQLGGGFRVYDYISPDFGEGKIPPRILALAIACMGMRFQAPSPYVDMADPVEFVTVDGALRMIPPID